jgi:hypothetical protein
MAGNTGYKNYANLELYYPDDNSYAGETKTNTFGTVGYIAPVYDATTCTPSTRYYNTVRTATATRNNCGSGYTGGSATMTAEANMFVSIISLADANSQADTYLAANVQVYANNIGTCTLITNSVTFSSFYSALGTSGTTNFSGTVTIVGTTATFKAYAAVSTGGPCSVSINVGGNTRTAFQSGIGTNNSTTFTLAPGTYSYSGSVTISSGYCQGGIQYPTQP